MKYILALDQGTTSSRAILFDQNGNIKDKAYQTFEQVYPYPGWVEHKPDDIFDSTLNAAQTILERNQLKYSDIVGIGITNQRETAVVWDKNTGKPVYNAIVWQCRRTASYMSKLKENGMEDMIADKTGLMCDAYFSASKIRWILKNIPSAKKLAEEGALLFGTIDTYLLWRLTGGKSFATDYSNASRTLLFNIHTLKWDEELCNLFEIPMSMLPDVYPSAYDFGYTNKAFFGGEIPILSLAGDQQAALFGQGCHAKGEVKNTYGTGCFLLMNTGIEAVRSKRGLITSLAAGLFDKPQYVLEGSVFAGGSIVQWLRDEMKIITTADETEKMALSVPNSGGVYIVPAFNGLGAPYWDSDARGMISGITRGTKREHFARAALEAIAYQVFDVVHAMERDMGMDVTALYADGGASRNNFLMQFQSDLLLADVIRPKVYESTAMGVAMLAGFKSGFYSTDIIDTLKNDADKFKPAIQEGKRRELILSWSREVARCRHK